MAPERSEGILVPVDQSVTLRETVAYAVSEAEAAIDGDPEAPAASPTDRPAPGFPRCTQVPRPCPPCAVIVSSPLRSGVL